MVKTAHIIFCLFFTFLTVFAGISQDKASLRIFTDREKILLGEQFEFSIELKIPIQKKIINWPNLPDTNQHIEIISRGRIDSVISGNFKEYRQKIIMTGFDSGRWKLPVIRYSSGKDEIWSNELQMDIVTVSLKGNEYNDLHEIIEVEKPKFQWWKLWVTLIVVAICIFLILLYRRNKVKSPVSIQRTQSMGSFEEAITQMNMLRSDKLIEKGEMKKYYMRLYDILRLYMSVKYTDDMVMRIADSLFIDEASKGIQCLRICEAVKFAKYTSSPSEADNAWREMYRVLELLNSKKRSK